MTSVKPAGDRDGLIANTFDPASATRHVFAFDAPLVAFSADFASALTGTGLFLEAAGVRVNFAAVLSIPGDDFLGIVSDTAFSTVTFSAVNEGFSLDDMATVAARPATGVATPMTAMLLGLGLSAVGFPRRPQARPAAPGRGRPSGP